MSDRKRFVEITYEARQDLSEIGIWTAEQWGAEQQDRYEETLRAGISRLRDFPETGRPADERDPGLRRSVVGSHVVIYREIPGGIRVIRVMHARQRWR